MGTQKPCFDMFRPWRISFHGPLLRLPHQEARVLIISFSGPFHQPVNSSLKESERLVMAHLACHGMNYSSMYTFYINYFTSSYPHHDIYTFCYWQIFWHSIWHIFWHFIWHIFWHSIWHIFWHIYLAYLPGISIWHIYLAYLLAFYLAYLLQYVLAYLLALYLAYLLAYLLTFYLAFYLANLLAFYLA